MIQYFARRYEPALREFEHVAHLDSSSGLLQRAMAANFDRMGRQPDAIRSLCKWLGSAESPELARQLAEVYSGDGFEATLRTLIRAMSAKRARGHEPATHIAELHARLGDREQAFRWLAIALREGDTELTRLKLDPIFDPLRGDARFDELLRQVGLGGPVTSRSGAERD